MPQRLDSSSKQKAGELTEAQYVSLPAKTTSSSAQVVLMDGPYKQQQRRLSPQSRDRWSSGDRAERDEPAHSPEVLVAVSPPPPRTHQHRPPPTASRRRSRRRRLAHSQAALGEERRDRLGPGRADHDGSAGIESRPNDRKDALIIVEYQARAGFLGPPFGPFAQTSRQESPGLRRWS